MFLLFASSLFAQEPAATVSMYGSGVARRVRDETANGVFSSVRSWEGGSGIAFEQRLGHWFSIEVAAELRRDIVSVTSGGRLCGPFRNTCFDTHRMRVSSTPVVLTSRFSHSIAKNFSGWLLGSARYVPTPAVRDLTPQTAVPRGYFSVAVRSRVDPEFGAGAAVLVSRRFSVFAEGRRMLRHDAAWDPRHRINAGLRASF